MGCSSCNIFNLFQEQKNEMEGNNQDAKTLNDSTNQIEVNNNILLANNINNEIENKNLSLALNSAAPQAGQEIKTNDNNENDLPKINLDKSIEEDFNELINNYPEKEDGIKVEKRLPKENEIDKTLYYGEWDVDKNLKHGRGIQIWPDGAKYIGYWQNDKACGKGKLYHSDGDIYEGDWLNDKPNGYGIYTHKDGTRYEGEWKDDKQNGNGKEIWTDGAIYEGQYVDGKKNGKGKFCWADGSTYEGNFVNNNINGEGKKIYRRMG